MGNTYQSYDSQISNETSADGGLPESTIMDSWAVDTSLFLALSYNGYNLTLEFLGDLDPPLVGSAGTLSDFILAQDGVSLDAFNLYVNNELIESVTFGVANNASGFFSDDLSLRQSLWDGNDRFIGRSSSEDPQDDVIYGYGGNDVFIGGYGSDLFFGGDGLDIAVMSGSRSSYDFSWSVALNADTRTNQRALEVTSNNGDVDRYVGVERVVFDDREVAFDLDGNAGAVAKILGAVFGAQALQNQAYVGIGLYYLDNGMAASDLMSLALNASLGGESANSEAVVNLLYNNLMGVSPDSFTIGIYLDLVENGTYNTVSLAQMAADSSLNTKNIDLNGLSNSGLEYLSFF